MSSLISTYQSIEQVQQAAEDYINAKNKPLAFEILTSYIIAKRAKQWTQELEDIMLTMIDLGLELKKVNNLREPLNNFKSISQYSNIPSLENVLAAFANRAEVQHKESAPKINDKFLEMEDLDNEDVDELFISSLSDTRSEKANIRESLKCLWDTYKIILEIIQKNKKLEGLYGKICKKAFEFCKIYRRKIEFKRLSETMRYNLRNIIKSIDTNPDYSKIPFLIDLEDPDTNDEQINIRFELLTYSYHFEFWQESIKILGDIHIIMQRRNGAPKSKTLSDYFEHIAQMFWKSEFYHYHAVAFFNHFNILKTKNKNLSNSELENKSCFFVLSVLAIPPTTNEHNLSEEARSEAISLISSEVNISSRPELITYILRHNILDLCTPEIKTLFFLIEDSVDVLSLAKKSDPLFAKIRETHPLFATPLQTIIIYKILSQLSKLYTKIRIESFTKFIGSLSFAACENIINLSTIHDSIKVKIDHRRQLLVFQDEAKDLRHLSAKLVNFSDQVKDLVYTIEETKQEVNYAKNLKKLIADAKNYTQNATTVLADRQTIINNRKKPDAIQRDKDYIERERERVAQEKERQEKAERERQIAIKEEEERKLRERRRLEELNELRKRALLNEIKAKCKGCKIGKKKVEEITDKDLESITYETLEKARSDFEKEEKQKEENLIKKTYRKFDYIERAKREEFQNLAKNNWPNGAEKKKEIEEAHKANFDAQTAFKKKITAAAEFRKKIIGEQIVEREKAYKESLEEFKEKINSEFKAKIIEKAKESLKAKKEQEEAENKKKEEEMAKKKAEMEENYKKQKDEQTKSLGLARNFKTREEMQEETKNQAPTQSTFTRDEKPKPPTTGFSRGSDFVKNKEPEQPAPKEVKSDGNKFFRNTNPTPTPATTQSSGGPPKFSSGIKRNEAPTLSNPSSTPSVTQSKSETKPVVSNSASNESKPSTSNSGGGWRSNKK